MYRTRLHELLALLVIGDGVTALLQPRRHMRLWLQGPTPYRRAMQPFADSRALARIAGVAEIAVGLWWADRQRVDE